MSRLRTILVVVFVCSVLAPSLPPRVALAATTITNCLPGRVPSIVMQLEGGGEFEFNCADDITTITLSSQIDIGTGISTTIDGNGVTFSGDGARRPFRVAEGGSLTLTDIQVTRGVADNGGAIISSGSLSISGSNFFDNESSAHGGAIAVNGPLSVEHTRFDDNRAAGAGGAIFSFAGSVSVQIRHSTFTNNTAVAEGGALYLQGDTPTDAIPDTEVSDSLIAGNSQIAGAIFVWEANFTLSNSTVVNNHSREYGGGLYLYGSKSTILQSTISANVVANSYGGGLTNDGSTLDISSSTFYANQSNGASSINHRSNAGIPTTTLHNTLLVATTRTNCFPATPGLTSLDYNVSNDASCALSADHDLNDAPVFLAPLAENGGETLTNALLPGSAAIDAGDPVDCPTTDQRGETRPRDGNNDGSAICDVGAFELAPTDTMLDSAEDGDGVRLRNNDITTSDSITVSFHGSASGSLPSSALTFECALDTGDYAACESPATFLDIPDGLHTLAVRANDNGSRDPSPASITWRIDTTPPDTSIDVAPPIYANSTAADFTFSGTDGDGSGVASFECRLDESGDFTDCTSPQSYTGLSEGQHTFEVRALDHVAYIDPTPATYTWTIDTTNPTISITTPVEGADYPLDFGPADFSCADTGGSGIQSCSPSQPFTTSSLGVYTFEVSATDLAGNTATQQVSYRVVYAFQWQTGPLNHQRAGDPIYMKFKLGGGFGTQVLQSGYPQVQQVVCGSGAPLGAAQSARSAVAAGLGYVAGTYQYIWATERSWAGTCRQFSIALIDGTTQSVIVRFTSSR